MRQSALSLAKSSLHLAFRSRFVRRLVAFAADELTAARAGQAVARFQQPLAEVLGPVVRRGPFAGMRYVELRSVGSALIPKLIGSYEAELIPVIDDLVARPYQRVIDIGAAEGYYAVGLAMRLPGARVIAFEAQPAGQALVKQMAAANAVADRVEVRGLCEPSDLPALIGDETLILSDCEGGEYALLNPRTNPAILRADILMEVHKKGGGVDSRQVWREWLGATHDLHFIDVAPRSPAAYEELATLSEADGRALLIERIGDEGWLFATRKRAGVG